MSKHCPYCFSEQALPHQPPSPRLAHRFLKPYLYRYLPCLVELQVL